jgi:ABC-type uncharacterized transport system substrate-binding protein
VNFNVNLGEQYEDWLNLKRQQLDPNESYVNISNFISFKWILDTQAKSDILMIDSRSKMDNEINKELINNVVVNLFQNQLD